MKGFFRFFVERHLLANSMTILLLLIGLYSLLHINLEEMPNMDPGRVNIRASYPGASPEDVELNVTNKIEDALESVTGIKTLTSSSLENSSSIAIEIDEDADSDEVYYDIQDAVATVTDLPDDVDTPTVSKMDPAMKSILRVGVSSNVLSYRELREYAHDFEKELLDVSGVAQVTDSGYLDREIHIEVSPDKLMKYGISMDDIMAAIDSRNIRSSGGTLESYTSQKNVMTLAQFEDPMDVGDVIVKSSSSGAMVYVKDVATIYDDFEDASIIPRINGKTSISFNIKKNPNADIIQTVDAVKVLVEEEKTKFTDGEVEFLYTSDDSIGVRDKFNIVKVNGILGLVLVLLVLSAFLNIRSSFWVAMGIPVSLMGVFILMPFFDVELDSLTMSAMVIVLGIIVDDAIVIAENIFQRRERGETPLDAAVNGIHEVAMPVFTTVATTILAFIPMFFIQGMMGKFVYVIPLTVCLSLSMSMLESYLILPAHILPGLRGNGNKAFGRSWFRPIRDQFERLMALVLKLRYVWVVLACAVLIGTVLYAATSMKFKLMDRNKNIESIDGTLEMPIGTSLEATSDKVREIENIIESMPEGEIQSYLTQIGTGGFRSSTSPHLATLTINLAPQSELHRPVSRIIAEFREKTSHIQDVEAFTVGVSARGPVSGEPIEIMIKGADDDKRNVLVEDVITFLQGLNGVSDVERDDKNGKDEIRLQLNYPLLTRYGLTVSDIAQTVRIAYDGEVATTTRYGDEDVDFIVIMQDEYRKDFEYLKQLKIENDQGDLINLEEVADLDIQPALFGYYHDDGDRTTTVTGDTDEKVITSLEVMQALQNHFTPQKMREYTGVRMEISGEAKDSMQAVRDILFSFGMAFVGIYFLLMLLFNSTTQPFVVILAIPFGIAGVIIAFALHGINQLTFLAAIGIVGMAGVVVNDALVMVNHLNNLKREGNGKNMASLIAGGAADRLRPVILTTVTTVVGLLPLAYGIGGEDAMMAPMAMALGYGILFATPITLTLLPCLYMIEDDIKAGLAYVKRVLFKKQNVLEPAEPAVQMD